MQRQRTNTEILTDLLRTEAAHRAASIRYRKSATKLPVLKDINAILFEGTTTNGGLVRSLHRGAFLPDKRNIVLVGETALRRLTWPSPSPPASCAGARGRYFNALDLITRLEQETFICKTGALAAKLGRLHLVVLDELGYLPFARSGGQL